MVTVITATNRPGNLTQVFADKYFQLLRKRGVEARHLRMEDLPESFGLKNIYDYHHPGLSKILDEYIIPAENWPFLYLSTMPGYPGFLRYFWMQLNHL